ncbi:MAG: branched-chain amino acid ABC transporter permease [Burkholderiaceae bacterium]|jgi:branched-chain amino acid transport system permease protein|nr:branched-chain amino acid ABC transporter permease [Burkholderiaceae bacterium]
MKRFSHPTLALYAAGILFLLAAPAFVYPVLVIKILCYAMFACAFNLLLGYTGLLSFGHAAFFGTAAYLTGHALKVWAWPTLGGIAFGTAAAALLGLVIGLLAIRRQGIYFSMITLAMAQLLFFVFLQAPLTGGENGLHGVPRGSVFGVDLSDEQHLYYFVVAVFVLTFGLIHRTIRSPFGQVLRAIRENEPRAISLGYDVLRYKLLAFVLSAALAGLAGATKVLAFSLASLPDAHWHTSGEVVLMSLLGGMGTVLGPVAGAAVVVTLQTQLADKVGSLITVIMGGTFVLCVLMFRRGIVGELGGWLSRQNWLDGGSPRR